MIAAVWQETNTMDPGDQETTESRGRLNELKREVALNRYEVDAGAVADAILAKLRLVKSGRLALAGTEADRSPRAPEQRR